MECAVTPPIAVVTRTVFSSITGGNDEDLAPIRLVHIVLKFYNKGLKYFVITLINLTTKTFKKYLATIKLTIVSRQDMILSQSITTSLEQSAFKATLDLIEPVHI